MYLVGYERSDLLGAYEWKETLTAAVYSDQLHRLADAVSQKRPEKKVILLHDNARPHVAKLTRNTLEELGWEVLPHPAYSPDLAPSDYHLFRSLQTGLKEKEFENSEEVKKYLQSFFDQKSSAFYKRGIRALPERWAHVIDCSGDYPDE